MFKQYHDFIYGVVLDNSSADVEEIVSGLYQAPNPLSGVNRCWNGLFEKEIKKQEKLSPT